MAKGRNQPRAIAGHVGEVRGEGRGTKEAKRKKKRGQRATAARRGKVARHRHRAPAHHHVVRLHRRPHGRATGALIYRSIAHAHQSSQRCSPRTSRCVRSPAFSTFTATPVSGAAPATPAVQINPSKTAVLHYSLALLPENHAEAASLIRASDFYRAVSGIWSHADARAREFITRYRLERKEPDAGLSEAKKPITFYLSRSAGQMAQVDQGRHRGLAARVRGGRVQECHRGEGCAEQEGRSGLGPEDARHSVIAGWRSRWLTPWALGARSALG